MEPKHIVDIVFMVTVGVIGVFGNALIIVTVIFNKQLQTISNVFIVYVAIADLFVCAFMCPIVATNTLMGYDVIGFHCAWFGYLCMISLGISINMLAVLAVDRYFYICRQGQYRKVFNPRSVVGISFGVLLYVCLMCMPGFFGWGKTAFVTKIGYCIYNHMDSISYTLFLMSIGIIMPLTITFICYIKTFITIRSSSKSVASHNTNVTSKSTAQSKKMRQVLAFFLVSLLFVLFWSPYALTVIIDSGDILPKEWLVFVTRLAISNSCVNSIMYGIVNKNFRNGYKKVLLCGTKQEEHREISVNTVTMSQP
ncbi:unnamed protein product [Owenia fusiformis]|uniref:Uncharacterized protein n=1 Tax=Owenia fusiformis TaxID=6347 RepID=A0A8J1TIP5_OWEFU|nr:unnamed protein product [Owenia fusiformis]